MPGASHKTGNLLEIPLIFILCQLQQKLNKLMPFFSFFLEGIIALKKRSRLFKQAGILGLV